MKFSKFLERFDWSKVPPPQSGRSANPFLPQNRHKRPYPRELRFWKMKAEREREIYELETDPNLIKQIKSSKRKRLISDLRDMIKQEAETIEQYKKHGPRG